LVLALFWQNFGFGQQRIKKIGHTSVVPSTTTLVCPISAPVFSHFAHDEHFLTRLLKNRGGMLSFTSRLYNRDCIFSTFYRSYIYCGSETALVRLIQPRLNVFFLLVTPI